MIVKNSEKFLYPATILERKNPILVRDSKEFREEDHKRDENGRFAKMDGEKSDSTIHSMESPQISKKDFINGFNSIIKNVEDDIGSHRITSLLKSACEQFAFNFENNGYTVPQSKNELLVQLHRNISKYAMGKNEVDKLNIYMEDCGILDELCKMAGLNGDKKNKTEPKTESKSKTGKQKSISNLINDSTAMDFLKKRDVDMNQRFKETKAVDGCIIYESDKSAGYGEKISKYINDFNAGKQKMNEIYGTDDIVLDMCILPIPKTTVTGFVTGDSNTMVLNSRLVDKVNIENLLLHEYQHKLNHKLYKEKKIGFSGSATNEFCSMVMSSLLDGRSEFVVDFDKLEQGLSKPKYAPYYFGENFGMYFYEKFGQEGYMDMLRNMDNVYLSDVLVKFYKRRNPKYTFTKIIEEWVKEKYPNEAKDMTRIKNLANTIKKSLQGYELLKL